MAGASGTGAVGWVARGLVALCFVGGAVAALTGRLVMAGGGFLAGHTLLAAAAVIQGQRRRGVGLSLSGVGWLVLSLGLAVGQRDPPGPEQPLLLAGAGLVVVGAVLLSGSFGDRSAS
ncbi:hypothetical protein [Halobellus limi]|uniref:Uncharacterized protein n=1 Tax=Halobellus limi TaxID=699433 RepID=A0A1H5VAQ5_9EURY|nr:hypothetical protein [Halobellus limi]QCC46769.1 hypothetical protein DV707_03290 [Halobellus limi]SEF84280.1 hypothetical protein SAMN04488133_0898 [Halobellus limi]